MVLRFRVMLYVDRETFGRLFSHFFGIHVRIQGRNWLSRDSVVVHVRVRVFLGISMNSYVWVPCVVVDKAMASGQASLMVELWLLQLPLAVFRIDE